MFLEYNFHNFYWIHLNLFSYIKIHTLKKEDRGTYYCVADNGIGKAAQRAVAVDVEFPPVVTTSADSVGGGESRIGQALGYR